MTFRARVRQVWDLLTGRVDAESEAWAHRQLGPALRGLYDAMGRYDRYHCTLVARRFAALEPPGEALQGALVHDCGKPPGYGLVARVFAVLFPDPTVPASPRERLPWRWAQQLYRWHGHYGAELARAAGLGQLGCAIVRDHHAPSGSATDRWLAEFQRLDDD